MEQGKDGGHFQRWYDQDPALKKALEHLKRAPDKYQAEIALNIIKIIVEHQIETEADAQGESLRTEELSRALEARATQGTSPLRRRWYDVNETLRSAIQLLRDCPEDLQQTVIPSIARMIEQTLADSLVEPG